MQVKLKRCLIIYPTKLLAHRAMIERFNGGDQAWFVNKSENYLQSERHIVYYWPVSKVKNYQLRGTQWNSIEGIEHLPKEERVFAFSRVKK